MFLALPIRPRLVAQELLLERGGLGLGLALPLTLTSVAADAAVVGGGEDGEQHAVVRDLEAPLLLGQLVRSDHALDPRALAERFRHVGAELDRVAASRSAGRDALPIVRVAPERVEEELVISRVELDRRLPLVVDLAQVVEGHVGIAEEAPWLGLGLGLRLEA